MKKILILVLMLCTYIANAQIEPQDTDGDGYRNVSTLDHLRWISETDSAWTLNYKLDNDINAPDTKNWNAGKGWSPIGSTSKPYSGIFDGNGYAIDGLFINRPLQDDIGLFGYTNESSKIYSLKVTNCNITGMSQIGGLVGWNKSQITECYTTGKVTGMGKYTGGLIGLNASILSSCNYSSVDVAGVDFSGGLIGYNSGTVSNSYATGNVNGSGSSSGGFLGENSVDGYVTNCYSCGKVIGKEKVGGFIGTSIGYRVTYCFWDKESSGQETSLKGFGKTTQEMKTKSTFTDAKWNFTFIWKMDISINDGYPYIDMIKMGKEPQDTDGDGYRNVSTLDHLRWISENSLPWTLNYKLDNDINAADTKNWNAGEGFKPIGSGQNPFKGIFDGKGYKIDSLYIHFSKMDNVGFFGATDTAAVLKNLGITNCDVLGSSIVGALIGNNYGGDVSNCYSIGKVHGGYEVGGLIGLNVLGPLRYSHSICQVTGGDEVGGLVGCNQGTLQFCYSNGSVAGGTCTGGLAGFNGFLARCSDCYSLADVYGGYNRTGGFIGYSELTTIVRCYSTGKVTGKGDNMGGFIGTVSQGDASACFWDIETSGTEKSGGGAGKSTENMKTKSTFASAGWDFLAIWNIDSTINNGYPYLDVKRKPKISIEPKDTDSDGYLNIKYFSQLVWVSENSNCWSSNFELDNDISADSSYFWEVLTEFSPIGNYYTRFNGIFDGKGHAIDSIINSSNNSYRGLFGYTGTKAEIMNLGVTNCKYSGSRHIGGFVGYNAGLINNCFVTGSITGYESNVGGFVGTNSGRIVNCYSRCGVKVNDYNIGSFVGNNTSGSIKNSYCSGSSTIVNPASIFVGSSNYGTINFCFFDIGLTETNHTPGGIPKITSEMKKRATFTDAGWDFDNIWDINPQVNDGYPFIIGKATDVIENKQDLSHISISPNPASDFITITMKPSEGFKSSEGSAIQIYNTLGELVLSVGTGRDLSDRINISALPKGMYFVRIGDEFAKFVKM